MKITTESVMYEELVVAMRLRLNARDLFGRDSEEYRLADRTVEQINAALLAHQGRRVKEELEAVA